MRVAIALYFAVWVGLIVEVRDVSTSDSWHIRRTASGGPRAKEEHYSDLVDRVHRQVNEFRRVHGLKPLMLDPLISAQAREHSADMAQKGKTISHSGFNQRLQEIGKKIPYRAAAENVAASVGYKNPAQTAVEGWKNSPEHRKNMLGDFDLTGIGVAQSKDGGYFFTQIFLKPAK